MSNRFSALKYFWVDWVEIMVSFLSLAIILLVIWIAWSVEMVFASVTMGLVVIVHFGFICRRVCIIGRQHGNFEPDKEW